MSPRFEKIPYTRESLQNLEKVLLSHLPQSIHMLVLCRMAYQDRFSKKMIVQFYQYIEDPKLSEKFIVDDKDPFIVCIERPNIHTKKGVILLTPLNPTQDMIQAFDSFIGWTTPQVFQCVQAGFWEHLQQMCTNHRNRNPDNSLGIPGILLAIMDSGAESNVTLSFKNNSDIADRIVVRSLEDKDVPEVAKTWKWAVEHSEEQIRENIKSLVSCGLFVKTTDEEEREGDQEELASCVLLSPLGTFNMLYTADKYRRRGFAQVVMQSATKKAVEEMGIPQLAEVEIWNDASKTLLERVGYTEVYQTRWYFYEPPCYSCMD